MLVTRRLCSACNPKFSLKRQRFLELEELYSAVLDKSRLTPEEHKVEQAHREAVQRGHFTYDDPESGEKVFTRYYHFLNGKCCGKASCRHCTYNLQRVPESIKKTKFFNSSFWRNGQEACEEIMVSKIGELIKIKPNEKISYENTKHIVLNNK